MNDTPEAQIKALLGCVSLEIIQSVEQDNAVRPVLPDIEALIQNVRDAIDRSNVADDLKAALKGTVGNWGGSNAQEMFKNFLIDYNLIDANITGVPLKRVKGIFRMRNNIAHKGEIFVPDWTQSPEEGKVESFFIIGLFIPSLIEEYINRKFRLLEFDFPRQNNQLLKEYISNGTWRNQAIATLVS